MLMATLSLVAFGGGNSTLPAMHSAVVADHHWLTDEQFLRAYTLGRLAPGPGSLYVSLIGYQVAGPPGAVVATVAQYLLPAVLVYAMARASEHFAEHPWKRAVERGLAPVVVGLLAAALVQVGGIAVDGPVAAVLAAASTVLLLRTRLSAPVVILAGGAVAAVLPWLWPS
ncbi:MAG TPA: chromate transporter [Chloroflexota bacterium]|nr:chromate transporter [Chloroflexota bacterium]